MTLTERKLKVAKENREDLIKAIKEAVKDEKSNMTMKQAMEAFLSARVKEPENYTIFKATGLQKVRKEASKYVKKVSVTFFLSEASKRQMPSSMR